MIGMHALSFIIDSFLYIELAILGKVVWHFFVRYYLFEFVIRLSVLRRVRFNKLIGFLVREILSAFRLLHFFLKYMRTKLVIFRFT